jgi:hypothetical protein
MVPVTTPESLMIKVYHAINPSFGVGPHPQWPKEYILVAEVQGYGRYQDLDLTKDTAFHLTNTIDNPWWENVGVKSLVGPARSTSVGDVIIENGHVWRCEMVGWEELKF